MKKIFFVALAALLAFAPVSFASIGTQQDGEERGQAGVLNFTDGLTLTGNENTKDLGLAGIGGALDLNGRGRNDILVKVSSSTPIDANELSYSIIHKSIGALGVDSVGTTLADGVDGQEITFLITGLVASGTWKLTPTNASGFVSVTFDAKGDLLTLQWLATAGKWVIKSANSVTITQA